MLCTQLAVRTFSLTLAIILTAQCWSIISLITHCAVHSAQCAHIEHHITHSEVECKLSEHLILMVTTYLIEFPKSSRWCPNPVPVGKSTALGGQSFIPNLSGPIYFSFVSRAQWPNLFFIYLPRGHGSGLELACYLIHHQGYLKAISTVPCHGLI